jgi:WD40 repeat protein
VELTNRVTRILYLDGTGLLAADSVGRLHVLDDDLKLVRSSAAQPAGRSIYGMAASGEWIVTRDWTGHISRWRADTLDLVDYLDPGAASDTSALLEGETPSLTVSRGLAIWDGRVYANNGFMQLVVLDLESFMVCDVVPSPTGDVPIEWICTEHPSIHAISDKEGRLFLGHLSTLDFPTMVEVDSKANLHRVRYDARHDRFWVTQDSGDGEFADVANGVVIVTPDGVIADQLRFARDDVEFVDFSADQGLVYAGGFDGRLNVFDNSTPELSVTRVIEPFSHQLSDFAIGPDGAGYVLSQDGEIVKLGPDGTRLARAPFRRQCVWDIQPSPANAGSFLCATDDGVARIGLRTDPRGEPVLQLISHHVTGFGFTRRIVAIDDGWAAITRDHMLLRGDGRDRLRWQQDLGCLPHTLAVSPGADRLLVATNSGAVEVDADSGDQLARFMIGDLPLWCCAYLPSGDRVLGTRNGLICAFGADGEELWRLDTGEYPKRMWYDHGLLWIAGERGVKTITPDGSAITGRWSELMSNTCENGERAEGCVLGVTYAQQLAAYEEASDELIGLVEELPGFPKGLTHVEVAGRQYVIVGGRGGYLSLYQLDLKTRSSATGALVHVRDLYLPRQASRG